MQVYIYICRNNGFQEESLVMYTGRLIFNMTNVQCRSCIF